MAAPRCDPQIDIDEPLVPGSHAKPQDFSGPGAGDSSSDKVAEELDELAAPAPDQNPAEKASYYRQSLETAGHSTPSRRQQDSQERSSRDSEDLDEQEAGDNDSDEVEAELDELAAPAPDQNPEEGASYHRQSLESTRHSTHSRPQQDSQKKAHRHLLRQLHIHCHLMLFSILGVLARVGIQALTTYPGAPVATTDLWANFGGCLLMGYLREDRALYQYHWKRLQADSEKKDQEAGDKAYSSAKTSAPSYIGLAVGFCGSFTTFASACRDVYLALANSLNTAAVSDQTTLVELRGRPNGDSVMAVLAVLILELGLSIVALTLGAHLAVLTEHLTKDRTVIEVDTLLNQLILVLGPGAWLAAIFLAIWSPSPPWRGDVICALAWAPLGCILRYQLSLRMNRLVETMPLGTLTANILGTSMLGMAYDLQHWIAATNIIGCQVLQGIEDGFCGALTTVSTFVLELDTLRLRHAYFYAIVSLTAAISCLVVIIGPLQWTGRLIQPVCT